jgi:hypothetical protein
MTIRPSIDVRRRFLLNPPLVEAAAEVEVVVVAAVRKMRPQRVEVAIIITMEEGEVQLRCGTRQLLR